MPRSPVNPDDEQTTSRQGRLLDMPSQLPLSQNPDLKKWAKAANRL
jgi:hypothetical protein